MIILHWCWCGCLLFICCQYMTFDLLNTQCSCTEFLQEIFNFWRKMCKVWNVWSIEYHEKEWDFILSCYSGCFPEIFYLCRKRIGKWILRWKRPLKSVDRLATFSTPHTLQRGTISMILISRYNWKMCEIMPGHWTTSKNWTLDRLIILKVFLDELLWLLKLQNKRWWNILFMFLQACRVLKLHCLQVKLLAIHFSLN